MARPLPDGGALWARLGVKILPRDCSLAMNFGKLQYDSKAAELWGVIVSYISSKKIIGLMESRKQAVATDGSN